MSDYSQSREFGDWKRRVERELVPKLRDSGAMVSLVPEGETDVKFAVELGMGIMMDKPILAVVQPGTKVPSKLVLVADRIIEGDMSTKAGLARVQAAIAEFMAGASDDLEEPS